MPKAWCQNMWPAHFTEALIVNYEELDDLNLFPEHSLIGRFPRITVEIESRHPPTDFFAAQTLNRIVSSRLKSLLEEFQVKAEYLELDILYRKRPYRAEKFYYFHLMDEIDCLDHERSVYELATEKGIEDYVWSIDKLVLNEEKTAGHHVFQIAKCFDSWLFVSDAFAERVLSDGFKSISIQEVDDRTKFRRIP